MSSEALERRAGLLGGAAVAVISLAALVLVMRLWRADLSVPFLYGGDSNLFLAFFKGTLEHGWLLSNPDLGAPFGQQLYDFPVSTGDSLHLLEVKFLGLFTSDPAEVLNLFFIIGVPLTGISAYAVFRKLGVMVAPAVVCGVLFALLPYHFFDSVAQPFHGSYWTIPIACYLILSVLADRPLFTRAQNPRWPVLAFASRRTLLTLLLCVLVGSAGSNYYALYAVLLVVVVTPFAVLRSRRLRTLVSGAVAAAAIVVVVGLNAMPTIIYHQEHGTNSVAGKRTAAESETYSLSVGALVLPIPGHRLGPLADLRERYYANSPTPAVAAGPGLGIVGAIGFLWLIGVALASCVGALRGKERWSLHGDAAVGSLASLLIATTGGFSIVFALLISPQLRVWERYYLFIAFFALLAVALLLEMAVRRIGDRRRIWAGGLLAAVMVLGVLDQTSNDSTFFVPPYKTTAADYRNDADFVDAIERRLPPGAAVFELPYQPFPDSPGVGASYPFDQVRGYLHSDDLRWSYGAMQGRPANWQESLIDKPVDLLVPAVAAAGFDGIWIDRDAYPDHGAALERGIRSVSGARPIVSANGRFSFFDLRAYARRLRAEHSVGQIAALRQATLYPVTVSPGDGLTRTSLNGGGFTPTFLMTAPNTTLNFDNPGPKERIVDLTLRVVPPPGARVTVHYPDGASTRFGAKPFEHPLLLQPGTAELGLSIAGPPGTPLPRIATELEGASYLPFATRGPAARIEPQPSAGQGGPASAIGQFTAPTQTAPVTPSS